MAVATAALVALLAAALPFPVKAVLVPAVAAVAIRALRRHGHQEGKGSLRCLVVDLAGRLEVEQADGTGARGRILAGCFVAPWFVLVRWLPDGRRLARTLFIAPDAVGADEFRRLRVLLRWR